jgi:2-dehydro-3-deoxy-D-arabinonate dehydratase
MTPSLFRVELAGGLVRLARGDAGDGPAELLDASGSIDAILEGGPGAVDRALAADGTPLPEGFRILPPVESQEVWAAGVTYLRSREARVEEALDASPYDRVYEALRPELFFKSPGWRVRGPGQEIAVRRDSAWNTPEPELALVLDPAMRIAGYTIGNDVSSRTIEGENPLYLPQAKVYDGSCALGPGIVPASAVDRPFDISMTIDRAGSTIYEGTTSTDRMKRSFEELAAYLGAAMAFPAGAVLLTGTPLVPESPFTLTAGDVVRISIEGLGMLENRVASIGPEEETT